jgi:hypothetical protein
MEAARDVKKADSRNEYWRGIIRRHAGSGQSVHAFCLERRLTEQSFYYWRNRLGMEEPVSFALVATDGVDGKMVPAGALVLDLGSSQCLRIPSGVDAATLRTVLAVLRERA